MWKDSLDEEMIGWDLREQLLGYSSISLSLTLNKNNKVEYIKSNVKTDLSNTLNHKGICVDKWVSHLFNVNLEGVFKV